MDCKTGSYIFVIFLLGYIYFFVNIQVLLRTMAALIITLIFIIINWILVYQCVLKKMWLGELIREILGIKTNN